MTERKPVASLIEKEIDDNDSDTESDSLQKPKMEAMAIGGSQPPSQSKNSVVACATFGATRGACEDGESQSD